MKVFFSFKKNSIKSNRGVALIMATSAITLMAWLAKEISYDASVEYTVNSQNLNRVKAYYAAKSAVDLGLLRVKIYQQVSGSPVAQQLSQYIDEIWKFKLMWPLPLGEDTNMIDRDNFAEAKKESLFDASWDLEISDEGSKLDLSDLVSLSDTLSKQTREQLLSILRKKIEDDYPFAERNNLENPETLVNNLTDWQSDQSTSADGSSGKTSKFTSLGDGYPPNRGFRTLEEIRLVPGMTNEIFEFLKDKITIYGMKAVNPNTSDLKLLQSLDSGLTDEIMKEVDTFRNDEQQSGFTGNNDQACADSFWNFVTSKGARLGQNYKNIPMTCQSLSTFRIKALGTFGQGKNAIQREIEVITMDLSASAARVKNLVQQRQQQQNQQGSGNGTPGRGASGAGQRTGTGNNNNQNNQNNQNKPSPPGKGPPRIVYWREK